MPQVAGITQNIDPRVIRVTIDTGGRKTTYEGSETGFDIRVQGQKSTGLLQNNCVIRISNMKREARDYLLKETSPFNGNRKRKSVMVEAGRRSTGVTKVYSGDVFLATPTQPPDIGMTLICKTGYWNSGNLISWSAPAKVDIKTAAQEAATRNNFALEFAGAARMLNNFSYAGSAWGFLTKLARTGGNDVFVDDDKLVVKPIGEARKGSTRILNENSGMIGVPEITERGLRVKFLYDAGTQIGGKIKVESKINPGANGEFHLYILSFDLASRDDAFYITAEINTFGGLLYG